MHEHPCHLCASPMFASAPLPILSGSPTKRASKLFSSLRRKSRSVSPSKEPRQRRERSPSRWSRRGDGSGIAAASRRNSGEHAAGDRWAVGQMDKHVAMTQCSLSLGLVKLCCRFHPSPAHSLASPPSHPVPAPAAPACRRSCCPAWPRRRRWAPTRPPPCFRSQWSPPWTRTTAQVRREWGDAMPWANW